MSIKIQKFAIASIWLVVATLLAAGTILLHEIAHYMGAVVMGAQNVHLHWADITFDTDTLTSTGIAVTALSGPLLTHTIIISVLMSRTYFLPALALGVGACGRNLLLLPFTIKAFVGTDVSTFSNDEVRAAVALDISPAPFAVFAVILGVVGLILFTRRAKASGGALVACALFASVILGFIVWSLAGPIVLPGGRGID